MPSKKQSTVQPKSSSKSKAPKAVKGKAVHSGKKPLISASGETCFWTSDGKILSNLLELSDCMSSIESEVFKHHVNTAKNDFANWVEDVLLDSELAAALRKSKQPKTAHTVIVRRLKIYDI